VLLDIGTVLAGIGLAIVAFIVVIVVCAVILALLAAILPSYEGRTRAELREKAEADKAVAAGEAPADDTAVVDPGAADTVTPIESDDPSPAPDGESDPAA
jgi:hypothetical protein